MLHEEQFNVVVEGVRPRLFVHVVVEEVLKISLNKQFDLVLGHNVIGVPLYAICTRIRVIIHGLVDVDGHVHGHGIPPTVLQIDDQ